MYTDIYFSVIWELVTYFCQKYSGHHQINCSHKEEATKDSEMISSY